MTVVRNKKGQFEKGSEALSPGRPKRVVEVKFHDLLLESVTSEIWTGIVKRAMMDALKGDKYARQFIAEYTIGKPPTILELRSGDAMLLSEVLKRLEAQGMSASAVFHEMLAQLAETPSEVSEGEDEHR